MSIKVKNLNFFHVRNAKLCLSTKNYISNIYQLKSVNKCKFEIIKTYQQAYIL